MKTIIKILLSLAFLTAMFNAGRAAFNNYAFEDAVHEGLLFNPRATDAEIVAMVLKLGQEFDVPIEPADVKINSRGSDLIVFMSYTDTVALIPGVFEREWTFTPQTSTRLLTKGGQR